MADRNRNNFLLIYLISLEIFINNLIFRMCQSPVNIILILNFPSLQS